MILDAESLEALAKAAAARLSVSPEVKVAALRAVSREAENLAVTTDDAPGALVFALARNPSAFRAFAPLVVAAALVQARVHGMRLMASPFAIADLAENARDGLASWEDVRAFFGHATLPFGG